jgi:hypothetical protein
MDTESKWNNMDRAEVQTVKGIILFAKMIDRAKRECM